MPDLFDKSEPEEEENYNPEKPLPPPGKATVIITCALAVLLLINLGLYFVLTSNPINATIITIPLHCDFNFTVESPVRIDYDCYNEMSFFNRMQELGKPGTYCFFNVFNQLLKSCDYTKKEFDPWSSDPIVFQKNSIWYMISGDTNGIYHGYNWSGGSWQSDDDLIRSLLEPVHGTNHIFYIKYSNGTEIVISENDTVRVNNKQQADSWFNDTTYIYQDPFNRSGG
jgi:hypothetical protein